MAVHGPEKEKASRASPRSLDKGCVLGEGWIGNSVEWISYRGRSGVPRKDKRSNWNSLHWISLTSCLIKVGVQSAVSIRGDLRC